MTFDEWWEKTGKGLPVPIQKKYAFLAGGASAYTISQRRIIAQQKRIRYLEDRLTFYSKENERVRATINAKAERVDAMLIAIQRLCQSEEMIIKTHELILQRASNEVS